MKPALIRARPACLAAAAWALAGCGATHDQVLVDQRTAELYGAAEPWFDGGAAAELPERADLAAYLRFGLVHNAELRAAFHRWRAAVEVVPQVTALPDPMFTYAHFVEDIETRTGPQRQRFSLEQRFPWFGTLELRGEVASADADRAWWQVVAVRLGVVREIKRAYHELAYLSQAIRITDSNLQLLRRLEPVVQRNVQAGANQEDLLRLQVEIGRVENDLETLRKFAPALSARLSAAVNRKRTSQLPFPDAVEPEVVAIDAEQWHARLQRDNPELAALREEIGRERARAELAGLQGWPDVTLGADYFETGDARMPGVGGSGDDPLAVRVMMNLPIWRGKYAAAVREAERRESAAHGELQSRRVGLRATLDQVAYELDDAARQIALYRDTLLPRARQAFEVTQASYRSGKATVLDVIDAERTLLAFEKSYWRAVSDYEQSLADLEALCGGSIR